MQHDGFQLVVASSASRQELAVLLKAAQVDDLLRDAITTTSDDAEASKPAPDIVHAALEKGGFDPKQVVMLADSPYDIAAANTACVEVIIVRCGGFSDRELEGAISIYDDPADLLANYDQSPLGAKTRDVVRQ